MVQFGVKTDVGMVREHNEDNHLVLPSQGLWLVADGMGGYEAGEVASAIVVEQFPLLISDGLKINKAFEIIHSRIHEASTHGRGAAGMGSTAVALQLRKNIFEIGWVGDSRAYLWDGSSLVQLTRDHSFVQQLLDSGALSQEEALEHPQRNVISQALGADIKKIRVDTINGKLAKTDRILLCSDGLTSELSDSEIAEILKLNESCQKTAELLVAAAKNKGGSDNITVVLVEAPEDAPTRVERGSTRPMKAIGAQREVTQKSKKNNRAPLYAIAGFLLAMIPAIIWFLYNPGDNSESQIGGGSGVLGPSPVKIGQEVNESKDRDLRELMSVEKGEKQSAHSHIELERDPKILDPQDDIQTIDQQNLNAGIKDTQKKEAKIITPSQSSQNQDAELGDSDTTITDPLRQDSNSQPGGQKEVEGATSSTVREKNLATSKSGQADVSMPDAGQVQTDKKLHGETDKSEKTESSNNKMQGDTVNIENISSDVVDSESDDEQKEAKIIEERLQE